jgi:hypothetical protein
MLKGKIPLMDDPNRLACAIFWTVCSIVFSAGMLILYFEKPHTYIWFASETGPVENIQAIFYLVSGIAFIYLGFHAPLHQGKWRFVLLPFLLGLFFIAAAGEETSWGQDYFHYSTPSFLGDNLEGESNIHNMPLFDANVAIISQDRALHLFVILYGIVIPIIYRYSARMHKLLSRISCPIVPMSLIPIFIVGFIYWVVMRQVDWHWTHPEMKELFFTTGFFLAAISAIIGKNETA